MTRARSLTLGLSFGLFTATLAIVGELLGWFNCINAWFVETVVLTLGLAVAVRRFRTITIGSSVFVAYITIVSYVVIHGHVSERWSSDDWIPVIVSFFLLVALPTLCAGALDFAPLRHAQNDA
jgi:hypothetical protein